MRRPPEYYYPNAPPAYFAPPPYYYYTPPTIYYAPPPYYGAQYYYRGY